MRRVAVMSSVLVALVAAGVAAQVKPNFSGEWKLVAARGQGEPGVDLIVTQSATSVTIDYVRGPAPAPAKLTYKLDGSVNRNMVAGAGSAPSEQLSRAVWAGNNIVVTTTTAGGEETRTFMTDGAALVIEIATPGRNGGASSVTKLTYQRYEQGFGG